MKAIRFSAHHLSRAGLFGIGTAAAIVVFVIAVAVRVLIAPISLGPFTSGLRSSLDQALPGLAVRFDNAALQWSYDEGRLNLVIFGARVFDENQRIIAQAPEAEVGLALKPFLHGRTVVHRIALVGVQLTLVHSKDGVLRLGVEGERAQSDILQRIRDAIARSGKGSAALDSFAVNKARLAFYEEETGAFIVSPDANLQVTRSNGGQGAPKGAIKATVDAKVEISGAPAHIEAVLNLPAVGNDVTGDISVRGLSVRSLASNAKFFSFLSPFDLKADITGSFAFANGTKVRSADFGIGAAGTVNGFGNPVHVRSFKIAGRYDGETGRLLIDDAALEGIQAQAHLTGQGDLAFAPDGGLTKASLDLRMDKFSINMPGVMGRSVTGARAAIRGSYVPSEHTIAIDQAVVYGGQLSAKLSGRVVLAESQSPEIDLDGNVAPLPVRDLLRYWPLQTTPGARGWIDANVLGGRVGPVLLHTRIAAGALDLPALPENAVSLTFPVSDGIITYIHGMTPLTAVNGTCALTGDTFKAQVDSAMAGPLKLSGAGVVIPNLHLRGTNGVISARVAGSVADVLGMVDQKPLRYPSRFQLRSATAKGNALVELVVRVPMLRDLRVDNIGISVKAATTDLGLQLSDRLAISNGNVNFDVTNESLNAAGTVSIGTANLAIDWTEAFKPKGPVSTRLKMSGALTPTALEQLGIHTDDYLSGTVGLAGEFDGYRGRIQRGQIKADLTQNTVALTFLGYRKPAGTAAQALINLRMDNTGEVRSADIGLTGTALSAHGTARFSPNGDLQALEVPSFRSGEFNDLAFNLSRDSQQGTVVSLTGRSFDAEDLFRQVGEDQGTPQAAKADTAPPQPFRVSAKLDRVVMRDGVVVSPFTLSASGVGNRLKTLAMSGVQSKSAQIAAGITNSEDGSHVKFSVGDAGLFLKGLFGANSLRGGTLEVDALMPGSAAKSDKPDYDGKLTLSGFTVVNQPFLMQLFAAAGSFGGLSDLLRGKGLSIDTMDVPFSLRGDVVTVRDARASASALGLTGDGYYDMKTNQIALQGVFTPLYGINGIAGSIPGLGVLLGSKKGEGLIGVTYTASGDADSPSVSANPLSVLAPGIIRRIFQSSAKTQPPVPQPKPQ